MAVKGSWTNVITRHFLAKVIIITLATSSAVVWASRPISAYASKEATTPAGPPSNASDLAPPVPVTSVRLVVTVMPSRLIVVDGNNAIAQIWSNTYDSEPGSYALKVRSTSRFGEERPLTDEISARYMRLAGNLDWSKTGLVYDASKQR